MPLLTIKGAIDMKHTTYLLALALAGCDQLGPRVNDVTADAPAQPQIDATTDTVVDAPASLILPSDATVPSISTNVALATQIQINDGLSDSALVTSGGVITRSTGKAAGATVLYWNFGAQAVAGNFVVSAPVYILAQSDGGGGYTPIAAHPMLIDSIPGDGRYSALRREVYVPVTSMYAGELITSVEALTEAIERGLVLDPVPKGTWRNMPVVPVGTKLEVGNGNPAVAATVVYGRGYSVELIPLGGTLGVQPLRNNGIPQGQESRLLSGVASAGPPPTKPTALDPQPVFQYGIPAVPPTSTFNYTPVVVEVDVRLADTIAPSAITSDADLFVRSGTGAMTAYRVDNVETFTVTTIVSNKQIQFVDGEP
jgi:hypothetical protein